MKRNFSTATLFFRQSLFEVSYFMVIRVAFKFLMWDINILSRAENDCFYLHSQTIKIKWFEFLKVV